MSKVVTDECEYGLGFHLQPFLFQLTYYLYLETVKLRLPICEI